MRKLQVELEEGVIRLSHENGRWTWTPTSTTPGLEIAALYATALSIGYEDSPDLGEPGFMLASRVAKKLKGKFTPPPIPPAPEGEVY